MRYNEEDELKCISVSNLSKFRSKKLPKNWDRPGREYKAEKKYRSGTTHTGKGPTLRDHRP
jgi:hypothetical protein